MEDIKKIQEFFSKPLEEGKQLDQVDFAKVVQAVTKTGHPVTVLLVPKFNEIEVITGMNAPDDVLFDLSNAVDALGYGNDDIIIAGDSSNLSRREYSDIRRVNGGAKDYFEESVKEGAMSKFTDYSNNELAAYAKELSKQRADAASKGQSDLLGGINKEIEAATRELKKRSQKLKGLSRTDEATTKKIIIKKSELGKYDGITDMLNRAWQEFVLRYAKQNNIKFKNLSDAEYIVKKTFKIPSPDNKYNEDSARYLMNNGTLVLKESVNKSQFKDLQIGDKFLRFGENGQLWKKTSNKQAEFIKNVGKKTSKYNKPSGSLNVFPSTMDVTLYKSTNESVNEQADHVSPMVAKAYREYLQAKKDGDGEKAYRYYSKKLNNTYSTRADRDAIEAILKKKYGSALEESVNEIKGFEEFKETGFKLGDKVKFMGSAHPTHTKPIKLTGTIEYFEPADEIGIRVDGYGKFIPFFKVQSNIEPLNEGGIEDIQKKLNALGVKYEMSKTDKVRPFKAIYKPINKSDEFYNKFEDIVDLYNLGGVVKTSMNEGAEDIMDAYNDVLDLVKKHSRRLSDDDSYAFGLKLKSWFNKNILDEATKEEETEFHKKLDTLVHDTFGKRKGEMEEYNTGIYYKGEETKDKAKEASKSALEKVKDMIQKVLKEEEGYSKFLKTDDNPEGKTKGLDTKTFNKILMNVIKDIEETIELGKNLEEGKLCKKGEAYRKKRMAAGEKSSAYLSGRAVKVCKGQMKG